MKVRTLIPTKQVNEGVVDANGNSTFRDEPAGYEIEDSGECLLLIKLGVAEPADEESLAACNGKWNPTTKEYFMARYDQADCAHTTGDPRYDSEHGEPNALLRMEDRLSRYKITFKRNDPPDVMKKHLKLVKRLKKDCNERIRREAKVKMQKTDKSGEDTGGRTDHPNPDS